MRIYPFFALVLVLVWGCSSSETYDVGTTTFQKNECVTAGAAYQFSYAEISGDCGPIPEVVEVIPEDGQITIEAGCDGIPRYEGCSVFMDQTCTDVDGYVVTQTGKVDWASDGSSGSGTVTFDIEAPNGDTCLSTYQVEVVRL